MFRTHFGKFKYLGILAVLSVTFELISNFTAARLVSFGGATLSVSIYCFPAFFLISDILTEVYGYSQARTIVWLSIFARVISGVIVYLLLLIPASPDFSNDAAYQLVLSTGLRACLAGLVAGFAGDMFNNYIVAKMKIKNEGKHLWARFVMGTFVGQGVNSVAFYGLAFYGVIPSHKLLFSMVMATIAKTLWEVIALPLTYPLVFWLKKSESIDYYDTNTNFNPLIVDASDI
jgi:uncharacterized integral membrane protein (TIGR00697 family)